ncbi:MAG: 3-hydroxyisobutyryl-CoA hydrolase [Pseudomonadota bacterium]
MSEDLLAWVDGPVGRLVLNRPAALNSLTHQMILDMDRVLTAWAEDKAVKTVLIEGAGDRAFCSGGDIVGLYAMRETDIAGGRAFWADEYRLNWRVATFPKPFVALMDGIVMGGGVGVSAHASHRIVTETTRLAMPECAIGLIPDVGGTMLLHQAPGRLGLWAGLTGARLDGADAIHLGFADTFVPRSALKGLVEALVAGAPTDEAVAAVKAPVPEAASARYQAEIDEVFSEDNLGAIAARLEDAKGHWADPARKGFAAGAPFALAATFEAQRMAAGFTSLAEALALEYRFSHRAMAGGDVFEGIRAMVIDKDRNPRWAPGRLEDVNRDEVRAWLAPLGEDELLFPDKERAK